MPKPKPKPNPNPTPDRTQVRCLHGSYSGCKTAEVIELKLLCLKLLLALLEGVQVRREPQPPNSSPSPSLSPNKKTRL